MLMRIMSTASFDDNADGAAESARQESKPPALALL